jgi:hypothetical protein
MKADAEVNQFLLDVIQGHGISAKIEADWVVVEGSSVRANGEVIDAQTQRPDSAMVELSMRLKLAAGRIVRQPVVGWGKDRKEAIGHAQASFLLGTLHAWLGAFIDPAEEHVERRSG